MSVKIGVFISTLRSGPITPRQQDLRAQLELPQLQTCGESMGLGGGDAGAGAAGGGGSQGQTRIAKEFLNYLEGMLVFKGYV